ncbi:hypothetical protein SB5439_05113 [Klebsiella variicola]|nr:hypothetical protein SB5439_05113 [Klebsiella variicola]
MTDLTTLRAVYNAQLYFKRANFIDCCRPDKFTESMQRIAKSKISRGIRPRGKAYIRMCRIEDKAKARNDDRIV